MFNDFGHCDGCGHLYCICDQRETSPAPKEAKMSYCKIHGESLYDGEPCKHCIAERRALYREAYMAALTGFCAAQPISGVIDFDPIDNSKYYALETVRQWDAMMAELEEG